MTHPFIQASFNSGEWAPHLLARTDLEKYHSGAALLENFFVDYRGGASTRSGSRYIIRGLLDTQTIRLIPFQAAVSVGFVLQFGNQYIRFLRNGAPVLEAGLNITGVDLTNPCVVHVVNSYAPGDWVFISNITGTTQLNGKYFIVSAATPTTITLTDLFSNPVDATGFSPWLLGGTTARVYTIPSPYLASDLALIKFTQNVDVMILCHPNYTVKQLIFNSPTNWVLSDVPIGTQISAPTNLHITTTLPAGSVNYQYGVTAVDQSGEESVLATGGASPANLADLRTTPGTITIFWDSVPGAVSYNVYKTDVSYLAPVPTGTFFGFIGNVTGTSIADSNIQADFSQPPPIPQNPFMAGESVNGVVVTNGGQYTTKPTVTFDPPGGGGVTAIGTSIMGALSASVAAGGGTYAVGNTITLTNGVILTVLTISGSAVATVAITFPANTTLALPVNPVAQASSSGSGTGATFNLTYQVVGVAMSNNGSGYGSAPNVTFSAGAVTALGTATMSSVSGGNPSVPAFFQQRLVLAGPTNSPETLFMSQPGNFFNFNTSNPIQDDNAIVATIVSGTLANIKAMVPQPGGLIVYTDDTNVLLNGGSLGAAVTPSATVANQQSHVGCNDMPPITVNFDILTVQSKGSSVRDSTYNFYANVYTGTDISILASHLFFGYQLKEWAWVEEPYKLVWAVRNDGAMLALTFIKEQDFTAWTHHITNGAYKSCCTIVEAASVGFQNFLYTVVQRTINGISVQYIEYFPERPVSTNAQDYWTTDCSVSYSGAPTSSFSGGEFLGGATVTGLADGVPITPFVMPQNGFFTLPAPASNVKIGMAFICKLQTLYIDLGNPTVQSKMKAIASVALRVTQALGLKIGSDVADIVPMKDLIIGNVGSATNQIVTGLVTGDAITYLDPKWQEAGQVYIQQDLPYPASILGFIPRVAVANPKP